MAPILPGKTIGILGGGQLGRMLTFAAKRLGYSVVIFSPEENSPAGQVADREIVAQYDDSAALAEFASSVDVVTLEFENVPSSSLERLHGQVAVCPGSRVLHIAQHRLREKLFLREAGLLTTAFAVIERPEDLLRDDLRRLFPGVLKTAGFGYDGKGQTRISSPPSANDARALVSSGKQYVLEGYVRLAREVSQIIARSSDGTFVLYPVIENEHRNHILHLSRYPARVTEAQREVAARCSTKIADELDLVGLLCVEYFIDDQGRILVNELAPRPHNSGHLTIEGFSVSQFEQQIRAVCGLPLVQPEARGAAAMINLLGDIWDGGEPNWAAALGSPNVALHLYGKEAPRRGRKMGHMTATGDDADAVVALAERCFEALSNECREIPSASPT